MSYKVLNTSRSFASTTTEPKKLLEKYGFELVFPKEHVPLTEDKLIKYIKGVTGIIVGTDVISRKVINHADKLKVISKHGVGLDNVDIPAATQKGIYVTAAYGSNESSVAELTIGLMLCLARRINIGDKMVRAGQWGRVVGEEINAKVLGIIGLGRIGQEVAKRASVLGMKVCYTDIVRNKNYEKEYNIEYCELIDLLKKSDFVSIHCMLNDSTKNIIGEKELNYMKKTSYLINTARGGIVDESALFAALKNKRIAGAALDVFSQEPPNELPFIELDNVILTPHIGAHSRDAITRMSMIAAQNIIDIIINRKFENCVNLR